MSPWRVFKLKFLDQESLDIANAWLLSEGFEYFEEKENYVLEAFWQMPDTAPEVEYIKRLLKDLNLLNCHSELVPIENWNAEWERHYEPVVVDQFCSIRAPFHNSAEGFDYEILIKPGMAFGTGHHATTSGMIKLMKDVGFVGLKVLDMGTGSGVLGILAEKLGAHKVLAVDCDEWAVNNALENLELNHCQKIEMVSGGAEKLEPLKNIFDVVLANINRNILLDQISVYNQVTKDTNSHLLISGFYGEDCDVLVAEVEKYNWTLMRSTQSNNWFALHFKR